MTGGEQEPILLAKGDLELLEDSQQHLAAGLRAAGLHEAQVPAEIPASSASSSWVTRRRSRHWRRSDPTSGWD